jgi:hypothetical protein
VEFLQVMKLNRVGLVLVIILFTLAASMSFIVFNAKNASALDENNCLSCHSKLDATKVNSDGRTIHLRISEDDVNNGAHRFIDCTTCHTAKPHDSPPALTKLSSAEKCGTCHQYEYDQHLNSIHGQQLVQGNQDVATCVDCHSPKGDAHSVIRVLEYGAPTYKKNIAETCAKCHNNEELMQTYGIVDKVYESYMRSYHGKALGLSDYEISQLGAATCTNCHGTHNISSISDPGAPVAGMDNLAKTCEQCHTGAGVEFAKGFLGHKDASPENVPAVHYVEKSFNILLYSVLGVGGTVVVGAVIGYSRRRWRE